MRRLAILALVLAVAGCGSQYERSRSWLEWFVGWNKVGSSSDYWLVKRSFGVDDPIGLMFGYQSDLDGCLEIAQLLNRRYPTANYTCKPAN